MLTIRRRQLTPETAEALAAARAAETRAEVERARALAELRREQAAAERVAALEAERDTRRAKKEREAAHEQERAEKRSKRRARFDKARQVAPLVLINAASAYVQAAYAYESIAPGKWPLPAKIVLAVVFAAAGETIALYVQWHAHDALVHRAYATAAKLRRASWIIAGVFASLNYSHFTNKAWEPTPAGIAVATFTLLSPWLWGLHTRRAQHLQLLAEDPSLIDTEGAVFSLERRRAFPIRTWKARRWSIDHGVRDPRAAWAGYNRDRDARRARRGRGRPVPPVDELDQNWQTKLEIIRLQARRARQAVTAGLPARSRTPASKPPTDHRHALPSTPAANTTTEQPANAGANTPNTRQPNTAAAVANTDPIGEQNTTTERDSERGTERPDAGRANAQLFDSARREANSKPNGDIAENLKRIKRRYKHWRTEMPTVRQCAEVLGVTSPSTGKAYRDRLIAERDATAVNGHANPERLPTGSTR